MMKKFGVVGVLMIAGLLASLCGIVGANSEFDASLTASNPAISFIHVPEYPNPGNDDLKGNVTGVTPDDYRVAVYIRVGDLWWIKPYYDSPLTTIDPDGAWTCDTTTGENDCYATAVAAYLLPAGVEPPICGPCYELPEISEMVACVQKELLEPRTISFAGYEWKVKRADSPVGPGPNYFSDSEEDVWVDDEGLHLTISEHGGKWYCTEAILDAPLGYGTYIFQTHGRVDTTDPMMVLGLFTWDGGAEEQNYREMDIEFARWGNAADHTNAQYVVQPCSQCPGCDDRCTRFRVNLTDEESDLTHYLVWSPGTVEFRTYYGRHVGGVPQASAMVHRWTHASEYVPEPGNENIRFNFWLHEGNAPANSQGDEVVITNFTWQEEAPMPPGQIVTNLINYPVTGCFEGVDEVRINDVPVAMDDYGGFRKDVVLNSGINAFEIDVIRDGEISESVSMEINYDPELSTENHTLLYSCDNPKDPATIVLDLDSGCILGVLSGVNIVAATHDGRYVVDTAGNVYQTSNHTVVGERLPFSQTTVYPVFSNDDSMCYAGNEKIRFADRTLVSDQIPVAVDCRFARLISNNLLIQGLHDSYYSYFEKINLTDDEVVAGIKFNRKRVYWGTSAVAPCGNFGFVTSYSWAIGALNIIDMETGNITSKFDYLSDYMGQISFSNDGSKAFVGSYGNSFFGSGGIYVIDVDTQTKLSYYEQFGASSVEVGPDGFIYTSSRFCDHFGDGTVTYGSKTSRGIDVLLLDEDNELQFIKTYYLNYEDRYSTKPTFFIKPGDALTELPDIKITDVWYDDSTIYYKIKNVGGKKAGASNTSLIVDCVFKTSDSVASLDPGVERTESFDHTWIYTDTSDMIYVCADYTDDVAEGNEANNCRTERWICPAPDIWVSLVSFDVTLPPSVVSNYNLTIGNDGMGVLEFYLGSGAAFQSGWPKTTGESVTSSPALGDIDGDSDMEVVVGSYDDNVYAWHHDGSAVSGWPNKTGGDVYSSPALGDIDGDGDMEVVVGSSDHTVYAWHHDGSAVNGWPKTTGFNVGSSPALGDIDGDGDIEVVVGSSDDKVYAWHHDGSTVNGWPKKTGNCVRSLRSSPALGDIDRDGDIEIVVGSGDNNVYAWDCSETYNPDNIEWGTFRHDVRHTGLYETKPPKPPKKGNWLSEYPAEGTVYPGNQTDIAVIINTTGLPLGEYSANITINNNDLDENPVIIPVRLTVTLSHKGDLNYDDEITPTDATIALQLVVSGGYDDAADVNGDDRVTSLDALMILQAAAGAISL